MQVLCTPHFKGNKIYTKLDLIDILRWRLNLNRSDEKVKTKIGTKNSCFDCFSCVCFSCFVFFSVSNFSTLFFSICDALNTCFESSRVELY